MAHEVWLISTILPLHNHSTNEWLSHQLRAQNPVRGIPWCYLFPFICSGLWTQRNRNNFVNVHIPNPALTFQRAIKNASEFYSYISSPTQIPTLSSIIQVFPHPWVTIDVNASFVSLSSISCVARVVLTVHVLGSSVSSENYMLTTHFMQSCWGFLGPCHCQRARSYAR